MDVRNCKSCGSLFNYVGRNICPACIKKREELFEVVKKFVRENPKAPIAKVSEETGASITQIKNWIREERLILSAESSIGVECERCGKPIRIGRVCDECKKKVTKDFQGIVNTNKPEPEKNVNMSDSKNKMRFLNK